MVKTEQAEGGGGVDLSQADGHGCRSTVVSEEGRGFDQLLTGKD